MNKAFFAGLIGLAASSAAFGADTPAPMSDIVVSATRIEHKDTETTYASEIHNREMIDASGTVSLYDYLAQYTSLNLLSSFGNKATPSIDMRGYGTANGYQNLVISVDGQRLNNIDQMSQLIGAIPLDNIDRIEITKGSGSVIYGDGAMAGSIQIYTRARTGVSVSASGGNYGARTGNISAGVSEQYFDFSVSAAHDSHDGYSKEDTTGERDAFTSNTQNAKLKIKPTDQLRFNLEGTSSRIDARYNNPLTRAQFRDDPRQNGGRPYNHQGLDTDQWRLGVEYDIARQWQLTANHTRKDMLSEYISPFPFTADYHYRSNDIALNYRGEALRVITGIQIFDGVREGNADQTSKDNSAVFLQGEYRWDDFTFSAGARRETVKYHYSTTTGPSKDDDTKLNAWDLGVNYRIDSQASVFANYNHAFQAPDIDRFFDFGGVFNDFIEPAKSRTLNIGFNHVTATNRLKLTMFYSKLDDEIYLFSDPSNFIFRNTNIDKSHKYGLELQDYLRITDKLSGSLIYTYTRAIIDRENDGSGTFNGKNLPGVPKHGINASLNYAFLENANININHVWRSTAYAANDFANSLSQKQNSYESTNIALSYRYRNLQWFAAVNNIFEHKNSIQIDNDIIYPVDFVRTWRIGMKADF